MTFPLATRAELRKALRTDPHDGPPVCRPDALVRIVASFPGTFTLPDGGGAIMRACVVHSYESEIEGPMIYTEVWDGSRWLAWAKGSPGELRQYMRTLNVR